MPEDIPEISDTKSRLPYSIDLLFAIVSAVFAYGWSVSGFAPNIVLACACWIIALAALLDFFRRWSRDSGKCRRVKWLVFFGTPILIMVIVWKPVVNQYHLQHLVFSPIDRSPRFEMHINNNPNPIVNGSVTPTKKGEGIIFYILNVGSNSANHLTVELYAPLNSSNITYTEADWAWRSQPLQRGFDWHVDTPQTHLLTMKTPNALVGSGMEVWGTSPLFISTNITIPIFDRKTLENLDFVFTDTNLPSNFTIPFGLLPVEVIILSDEVKRTDKRVFFIKINQ